MRELQLEFITNPTTKRLIKILSLIEKEYFFTIVELSQKMNVTQRTIATDVKHIKEYFGDSILINTGYRGHSFVVKKSDLYQKKKKHLFKSECFFEIIKNIFFDKRFKIDELAHKYHLSESTLRRLLKNTNKVLEIYGLKWSSNPLFIQGKEENLRKFFFDFYYKGVDMDHNIIPDFKMKKLLKNKLIEKKPNFEIGSGATIASFYYTFYIAVIRASLGYNVSIPEEFIRLACTGNSFSLFNELKPSIKEYYNTNLSVSECAWIYLTNICKRSLFNKEAEYKFCQKFRKSSNIENITKKYLNYMGVKSTEKSQISIFLNSFFLSREVNYSIAPVLNKESSDIKEDILLINRESYQRNLKFLSKQKNTFLTESYMEDICVSLTIYSNMIFDLYNKSKIVCFLLEGDHFVCQQIQKRARQHFGEKHWLIFEPDQYVKQQTINSNSIDLIVTNYSQHLLDNIHETEYVLLKPIPDENDWLNLEKKINNYTDFHIRNNLTI
ncbi:helix-turn-helix domain-containing protein [Enterococcus innesii]|uniref:helix-turn-helix domain-containing protein n=1 Tax=Enterococcus innesii TaxID=2839759 RepID=UPI002DBBB3CC|nr:helix-turn-helix domain-containing protein [Enterococcus innesii]MEB5953163.1 helix-turn-helix domain-containing protein [Enterococcus innesii]